MVKRTLNTDVRPADAPVGRRGLWSRILCWLGRHAYRPFVVTDAMRKRAVLHCRGCGRCGIVQIYKSGGGWGTVGYHPIPFPAPFLPPPV